MEKAAHTPTPDTQLFRDVFNASPIGIAVENLAGQPLFVNPAFCSMIGFSAEELCGKHCVDFSPPEDAERDWALFQQLRAGSIDHYQLEKRYFRRDGSLVWGNLSVSLLKGGPSPLVLAMVEDITDKKRAEEARSRHAAIVESSEDAIGSVTLGGVIESWNKGAQRIFEYAESEILGKRIEVLVPPERLDEEKKILETLRAGGRLDQFETVRVTKTGKRVHVSVSISAIKDSTGKIVGFSGISRDITERKRAEQAVRASEERLRLARQAANLGTFEWNIWTNVNNWTPELEAIYGLPPGGFGGTLAAFESLVYCDDRPKLRELVESTLKTEGPITGEWRVIWPDGSLHWVAAHWQVLKDESGKPSWVVGANIDVTERKRAEEALSSLSRKLIESQEQERARIGRELHDDISQRLAMLGVGLEQLQNNPLEAGRHLQKLREETMAISSEVQALSHELHASKLEYLGVVAGMRSWCREFGERQKMEIDFRSDVSSALPFEVGLSLFRVLQEALHNVVKHSGIKDVEVRVLEQSNEVHLTVTDSGSGFDIEAAKRGSGLGLTSMKERVQLVNGQLSIESKPLEGTTIHARVPLGPKVKSALAGRQS